MHSKNSRDNPNLNNFDLRRQISVDPFYESINSVMEIARMDQITEPDIPLLLPRDITSLRLQAKNVSSNYLSTALCAIASQEDLLYTILGSDSISEDGRYSLKLTEMGQPVETTINEDIIAIREGSRPLPFFIQSSGNDIWAYILEKAYAHRFGLYSVITEGQPYEVIHAFLDGDYKLFDLKQETPEAIWSQLKSSFRTESANKVEGEQLNEYIDLNMNENKKIVVLIRNFLRNGVQEKVCFRVVDYKTVKAKEKLKYVKLQVIDENIQEVVKVATRAWGEEEMATLDQTQQGANRLWILLDDLMKHFSTMSINSYRFINKKPEFNKSILKMSLDGEHSCVLVYFEAPNPDDKFVIGVHQKSQNYFKHLKKDYQYGNLRIVLIRLEEKDAIKKELVDADLKEVMDKLKGKKIYSGRFESCSVSSGNTLSDIFLKHRLKKGKYIIALEVFWKVDYFRNITLSFASTFNCKVEPKLISSGSNFDIVFYKTFVWYYLDLYESLKGGDSSNQKSLKNKELDISEKAKTELDQITQKYNQNKLLLPAKLNLSYLELMDGFFIVQCNFYASDLNFRIHFQIDPLFLENTFIISPELLNLLEGNILDLDLIHVDIRNPICFFLVRRNLSVQTTRTIRLESFFKDCTVIRLKELKKGAEEIKLTEASKKKYYDSALNNLFFEHLYFETMFETSLPNAFKPDKEALQILARQVIKAGGLEFSQQALLTYQFGLDEIESEGGESDLTLSFLEMNQETVLGLVRRFGKQYARQGNLNFEYQIREYVFHSENFLAILVENKELNMVYTERREIDMINLYLDQNKEEGDPVSLRHQKSEANVTEVIEFVLLPKQSKLILLNVADGKSSYRYKYKIKYKVVRSSATDTNKLSLSKK